jgi:hypothetical protein
MPNFYYTRFEDSKINKDDYEFQLSQNLGDFATKFKNFIKENKDSIISFRYENIKKYEEIEGNSYRKIEEEKRRIKYDSGLRAVFFYYSFRNILKILEKMNIINEFEDDPIFLALQCNPFNPTMCQTINTYPNYLSVFGFGGKTRGFCYGIMFLNLVIFRLISLLALRWTSHNNRGKRHLYKDENFE